jgi:hypothetical protein
MHRRLTLVAGLLVAGLFAACPAAAAELPTRKAGLWQLKMTFEGRDTPPQAMQHCTDPSTDKLMTSNFGGPAKDACSKRDIQNSGGTITVDSVCKFGAVTVTSHAVVSGDFNQAYTVKVASKRDGGPPMPAGAPGGEGGQTNMLIEAKWLGPCKPDQKAGDMMLSGGMKINVLEMPKVRGGAGGPPGR